MSVLPLGVTVFSLSLSICSGMEYIRASISVIVEIWGLCVRTHTGEAPFENPNRSFWVTCYYYTNWRQTLVNNASFLGSRESSAGDNNDIPAEVLGLGFLVEGETVTERWSGLEGTVPGLVAWLVNVRQNSEINENCWKRINITCCALLFEVLKAGHTLGSDLSDLVEELELWLPLALFPCLLNLAEERRFFSLSVFPSLVLVSSVNAWRRECLDWKAISGCHSFVCNRNVTVS